MPFINSFFSAANLVIGLFLVLVVVRAIRKFQVSMFYFILAAFIVVIIDSILSIISIFVLKSLTSTILSVYILSEFALLLIFYLGTVQRR